MAKTDKEVAIKVEHVAKDFVLPHENSNSLKTKIIRIFNKKDKDADIQHALKNVSFEVKKGEFFGIVGRNGSGKSTLLKIISEIYKPTRGKVTVNGRLVPFIELGVGFNPELTGRENVYLNGALLGFSQKELEGMYDDIVEFAELEDFMDQKLKNYSSGMQVRLAFSVAIRAKGDILVLDEVLAVGDEAFQRKCNDYFYQAKKEGRTVIIVTHSMESVRQFCDRAVLIKDGVIAAEGNPDKVATEYSKMFNDEKETSVNNTSTKSKLRITESDPSITLGNVVISTKNGKTKVVGFREDFQISVSYTAKKKYDEASLVLYIVDQAGRVVSAFSTQLLDGYKIREGANRISFAIENSFTEGDYTLNLTMMNRENNHPLLKIEEIKGFSLIGVDFSKYSKACLTYPNVTITVGD